MNTKTFDEMKTNIGNEVGDTSSSFATRLGVYINNRYFDTLDRLRQANIFEMYKTHCATTTAGTADYATPSDWGVPVSVVDFSNSRTLDVISEEEYAQRFGNNPTTPGAPIALIMRSSINSASAVEKKIGFYYVPAGSYEYEIRYERDISPMTATTDTPIVGELSDIIELGGKADAWRTKRQGGKAADFETLYERKIDRYIQNRVTNYVHMFDVTPYDRDSQY